MTGSGHIPFNLSFPNCCCKQKTWAIHLLITHAQGKFCHNELENISSGYIFIASQTVAIGILCRTVLTICLMCYVKFDSIWLNLCITLFKSFHYIPANIKETFSTLIFIFAIISKDFIAKIIYKRPTPYSWITTFVVIHFFLVSN